MKSGEIKYQASCRLCNTNTSKILIKLKDYNIFRCHHCSFVFSDLTENEISELYDEKYFCEEFGPYFSAHFSSPNAHLLKSQFEKYATCLKKHQKPGRVLDVGCAAGLFLDTLRQQGWKAEGVEVSPYAADAARRHTKLPIHVGDFTSLNLPTTKYEAICMLDLLEHLADPALGLRQARRLLHSNGVLLLVLPNYRNLTTWLAMLLYRVSTKHLIYPASKVHQIYHVSYFTPRTISRLLKTQGFKVLAILPDETVTGLLNEPLTIRVVVRTVFTLSKTLNLQNKMIVLASPLDNSTTQTK